MSVLTNILGNTNIPYTIGSKTNALPVNVTLSLDKDFKNTVYKTAGIIAFGIVLGVAIYKFKKSNKNR
jgi:hypothetical protein